MANKWRTTISDSDWTFGRYTVNPNDLSDETLVRRVRGVDRANVETLVDTLRAVKTVADPVADHVPYDGTFNVKSVDWVLDESGNTSGSVEITQTLARARNDYATTDNLKLVRSRAYPTEQSENAWMYYERFKEEETTKWRNMTLAAVSGAVFNGLRRIWTYADALAAVVAEADTFSTPTSTDYYHRKFTYNIFYCATNDLGFAHVGFTPSGGWVAGKYYIGGTPTYYERLGQTSWWFTWEEIENPIIRECYYEENEDGTFDIYRVLETTTGTALVRTRPLQYAGMVRVKGEPVLDATTITLHGFIDQTTVVRQHARFRIGGDTYRVLADATAAAGEVTLSIFPAVTQATEDACDGTANETQAFFEAL